MTSSPDKAALAAIRGDMVKDLRKLAENATPGPWTTNGGPHVFYSDTAIIQTSEANAAYIVAVSPDVVLAFIARMEALEAENARLSEALKPFARIADMEEKQPDGASVMVNVSRCRDARAARTTQEATNAE